MILAGIPNPFGTLTPAASSKAAPSVGGLSIGVFRLPTDPLYFTTVTLDNIVVGSRYRLKRHSDGTELATGVAASTSEVITGIPVYETNMLIDITVRKASESPYYTIFDTATVANPSGSVAYILQQLNE